MRTVVGAGCWPGQGEGPVVWLEGNRRWSREPVADRASELFRFRAELGRAVSELDTWSERQETVAARLALQGYRDALLEDAWGRRVCALIDAEGLSAPAACLDGAQKVGALLARSPALQERAHHLIEAAQWLAGRLAPAGYPPDAILAAERLTILDLLDRQHPALVADPTPPVVVGQAPLIWGVPGLSPDWAGRRLGFASSVIRLDVSEHRWWQLRDDQIQGHPLCYPNGDIEAIERMARRLGRKPVALIQRLDDLAAVPLFVAEVAAVAVDLDRLGPTPRLKHPGLELLLRASAAVAASAGVPMIAGGEPAARQPERWVALGFSGFFSTRVPQGGHYTHALRRGKEGSM